MFNKTRLMFVALAICMSAMLNLVWAAKPAQAGSNGQQVALTYTTCVSNKSATSILITGQDANGQSLSWQANLGPAACGSTSTIVTTGYYFVGTIKVGVFYPTAWRLCTNSVPLYYETDEYPVSCR